MRCIKHVWRYLAERVVHDSLKSKIMLSGNAGRTLQMPPRAKTISQQPSIFLHLLTLNLHNGQHNACPQILVFETSRCCISCLVRPTPGNHVLCGHDEYLSVSFDSRTLGGPPQLVYRNLQRSLFCSPSGMVLVFHLDGSSLSCSTKSLGYHCSPQR